MRSHRSWPAVCGGATVALLTLALTCQGCRVLEGTYMGNRLDDLTDVAHVEVTGMSLGALANVGPLLLGYERHHGIFWSPGRTKLGLGGRSAEEDFRWDGGRQEAYGVGVPLSYAKLQHTPGRNCVGAPTTPAAK